MNIFCTLFDSFYLTRGLALYHSLKTSDENFKLYIFCFDDQCYKILSHLRLDSAILISLSEFENSKLLAIKPTRTKGEYCWTCTPHTIRYVMDRFQHHEVTYLDADLYFFQSPKILLEEFRNSNSDVLITEHRYTPEYDQSQLSGIYCVQFISFNNNTHGRSILNWWAEKCLDWCFNRYEDGKFGDQKYLDDWPNRFHRVHVLQHLGGGVAPWNIQQYKISLGPTVDGVPIVFYHYHSLKMFNANDFDFSHYRIRDQAKEYIYIPYANALVKALHSIQEVAPSFGDGFAVRPTGWRGLLHSWKRKLKGTDNHFSLYGAAK